jgi:alcohol dehydrogenase
MKILQQGFRVYTDKAQFEDVVEFYKGLLGIPCERRVHVAETGVTVAKVGGFLVISGDPKQLDAVRYVNAIFYLDSLDAFASWLVEQGVQIIHEPRIVTSGRNLTARHPDGLVVEYFEAVPPESGPRARTMKAWRVDHLGGKLSFVDAPVPEVRPGSVLVRVETQSLMSYLKPYLEGALKAYRAPKDFIPGGNAIGVVEEIGADVWHLKKGQRVVVSSHLVARENVQEPGQILIGVTSPGGVGDALQESWKDGTLAEYALFPAQAVTPIEGLENYDLAQLATITRCVVPYGGLVRGQLAPGETVIINGATGAYGSAAVLVALAMGASRIVAAGRNEATLREVVEAGGSRVHPLVLSGHIEKDTAALRNWAGGGAHLALDLVGNAKDSNSTMAVLGALNRGGRLVLMGGNAIPVPINYLQVMFNNLEIIGNFMHPQNGYLPLLALVRSGQLDLSPIKPKTFALPDLETAMDYAGKATGLEIVVVSSSAHQQSAAAAQSLLRSD